MLRFKLIWIYLYCVSDVMCRIVSQISTHWIKSIKYLCFIIIICTNLGYILAMKCFFTCIHCIIIFPLLFSNEPVFRNIMITNFSFLPSIEFTFSMFCLIFSCMYWSSFIFQIYLDRAMLLWYLLNLNNVEWLLYHFVNLPSVKPI